MSEKKTKLGALMGAGSTSAGDGEKDWKAMYEEAERKFASAQVEQGRVKKLAEEKAELQRQIDELKAKSAASVIPSDLGEKLPEETRDGLTLVAKSARSEIERVAAEQKAALEAMRADLAKRDERDAAQRERDLEARLNREYPGFLASVDVGGDKHDAWAGYCKYNQSSIASAMQSCDYAALKYHVDMFYRTVLHVEPPSGKSATTAAEPRPTGGGGVVPTGTGKVYTSKEYDELFDLKEKARAREDWAEVRRLSNEIDKAPAEGRVKD